HGNPWCFRMRSIDSLSCTMARTRLRPPQVHSSTSSRNSLPADHVIGPMIAIGKGTKESWPKPGQLSLDEVVIKDRFTG
ncbi:MAG: hypothetical protein ACYTG5_17460, partial [Planctomycetota bacterium]